MRVLTLGALFLIGVVVAACGGGGDAERDEDAIRRNVERAGDIFFGDEVGLIQFQQYVARECRDDDDLGNLLLGRAFLETLLGSAEVRLDVTSVEFLADDRALVSVRVLVDGEAGLLGDDDDDDDAGLWVLQDGTWRSAEDCEFYGTLDEDGDDTEGAAAAASTASEVTRDADVGDALAIGAINVSLTAVDRSSVLGAERAEGVFITVVFTLTNQGREPIEPLFNLILRIFDDQGRTWDTVDFGAYAEFGAVWQGADTGPGFTKTYTETWDVPGDATGFRVTVRGNTLSGFEVPDDFIPYSVALPEDG